MKRMTAKVTYSLDALTVLEIDEMAAAWHVPKSEVIRRAVHLASEHRDELGNAPPTAEQALNRLQAAPGLTSEQRDTWMRALRTERKDTHRP
jgi:hypothetical protein